MPGGGGGAIAPPNMGITVTLNSSRTEPYVQYNMYRGSVRSAGGDPISDQPGNQAPAIPDGYSLSSTGLRFRIVVTFTNLTLLGISNISKQQLDSMFTKILSRVAAEGDNGTVLDLELDLEDPRFSPYAENTVVKAFQDGVAYSLYTKEVPASTWKAMKSGEYTLSLMPNEFSGLPDGVALVIPAVNRFFELNKG